MEVMETATTAVFSVAHAVSIPSDAGAHKVVVGSVALAPEFSYEAVPRAAAAAFLTMRSANLSPYALLPGPVKATPPPRAHTHVPCAFRSASAVAAAGGGCRCAQVFLDGAFAANAFLPRVAPGEHFSLPLGADDGLQARPRRLSGPNCAGCQAALRKCCRLGLRAP